MGGLKSYNGGVRCGDMDEVQMAGIAALIIIAGLTGLYLGLFNRLIVMMMPLMPRFLVGTIASRYVAGDTQEEALELVARLNRQGFCTTLDVLGEDVTTEAAACATRDNYLALADGLAESGVDANISIKLTAFGLVIDTELCWENVKALLDRMRQHDIFLRIDMEDSAVKDATLALYHRAKEYYPKVGVAIQAYLHSTLDDVKGVIEDDDSANFRLCKGIYKEPPEVAIQNRQVIRDNFMAAAKLMLEGGAYVGLATHDLWLVEHLEQLIRDGGYIPENYEFQSLLGVPIEDTLDRLVADGHRVRYYVPFGPDWYPYSIRRLRENPKLVTHVIRSLFFRSRHRRG